MASYRTVVGVSSGISLVLVELRFKAQDLTSFNLSFNYPLHLTIQNLHSHSSTCDPGGAIPSLIPSILTRKGAFIPKKKL